MFTQGGPAQIAERSEWISTAKDLELEGQVTAIEAIDAGLALPTGATAELYARTCATVTACDAAPWSGPHAPGAQLSVTAARYAQLRVVLTSNGVDEPTVDFVELRYRVAPP